MNYYHPNLDLYDDFDHSHVPGYHSEPPTFRAGVENLESTIKDVLEFYERFKTQYDLDVTPIREYANPQLLSFLWERKAAHGIRPQRPDETLKQSKNPNKSTASFSTKFSFNAAHRSLLEAFNDVDNRHPSTRTSRPRHGARIQSRIMHDGKSILFLASQVGVHKDDMEMLITELNTLQQYLEESKELRDGDMDGGLGRKGRGERDDGESKDGNNPNQHEDENNNGSTGE